MLFHICKTQLHCRPTYFYVGYICCCFVISMKRFEYLLTQNCHGQSCCHESTGLMLRPNSRWIQNRSGRGGEDKFYPDRKSNSDHSVCSQCSTDCTLPAGETVYVLRNIIDMSDLLLPVPIRWDHAVAQLVEANCYKSEDRGFDCRYCP